MAPERQKRHQRGRGTAEFQPQLGHPRADLGMFLRPVRPHFPALGEQGQTVVPESCQLWGCHGPESGHGWVAGRALLPTREGAAAHGTRERPQTQQRLGPFFLPAKGVQASGPRHRVLLSPPSYSSCHLHTCLLLSLLTYLYLALIYSFSFCLLPFICLLSTAVLVFHEGSTPEFPFEITLSRTKGASSRQVLSKQY